MSSYLENSKKYKKFHYSLLTSEMLSYLHRTGLEMLKVIKRVFEDNGIRYMICGGTLLGAVTTGKFISWDDDVDICILEDDYEKALDCLIASVPEWMCVQCAKTEPKYYHGWAKVRDKNSHVYPDTECYKENGVWIDLYKLSLRKKAEIPYLVASEHLGYLNRRFKAGDISETECEKRIRENNLIERTDAGKKISADYSESVYIIWSASGILIDPELCMPREKYFFEGTELYSFKEAKQYLIRHYGEDYMKLPPDEMRRIGINRIEMN